MPGGRASLRRNALALPDTSWSERVGGLQYRPIKPMPIVVRSIDPLPLQVVEKGFVFDADIPWIARGLVSPHDPRIRRAVCYHDFLLHVCGWDKPIADAIMYLTLKEDNAPEWMASGMHSAVHFFGWKRPVTPKVV